jgi:hypothetical protein
MRVAAALLFLALAGFFALGALGPAGGAAAPERPRPHAFVGEVSAVYPAMSKLVVRENLRAGATKGTTFLVNSHTRIVRGKKPAELSEIRANDHVTIKYVTEAGGLRRALTIRVVPVASSEPAAPSASK